MPAPERTELAEAVSAGAPAARVCGRDPAPGWGSRAEVMRLQRAAGNRAVAREGRRRLQRSGGDPVGYPAPAPPYSPPSPPVPVRPRVPAPAPAPDPAPAPTCPTPFAKASSFQSLISLVSAAEARLTANGITTPKEQIHALRGIYYGTTWSMDYAKAQGGKGEKSATRNEGFQRFTRPSEEPALTVPVDVRPMLDCGLFEALRDSPEVTDQSGRHVDVGHLVIGLDARFDPAFKDEAVFKASVGPITKDVPMGGTGLECVTWLGDLGGGAASLAIKRVGAPATSASAVFAGSDYGGSINLEGDVAAFVVAGGGAALVAPTFAPGTRMSDALAAYLSPNAPSPSRRHPCRPRAPAVLPARDAWRTGSASCAAPASHDRRSCAARTGSSRRSIARGLVATPVWRPKWKVIATTSSASAKALSGSPATRLRSKVRLSPRSGWITGVPASSAVSASVTAGSSS